MILRKKKYKKMIKQVEGIIISTVDYKESSKILNILTKNEGLIGVIAKGCKSPRNKNASTSNTLTYGIFHLNYNKGSIPLLLEVDVIDNFKNIRKNFLNTNYAIFLLELVSQVYKHDKSNSIYELLIKGLRKINEKYDPGVITNIIELQLLHHLGIKPVIDKCVSCGTTNNIITVSSYKGGYLCRGCLGNEPIYSLKTIKLIRLFCYIDLDKITKLDISDIVKKEISTFIDDYYDRYSGLYLKSKHLLENIK